MLKFKPTKRGFLRGEFKDRYGAQCSVQESSLATEACIWFGVDVDFEGGEVLRGRMHLNQEQVRALIPFLRHFVRTGSLGTDTAEEAFKVGAWVRGVGKDNNGVEGRIISINRGEYVTIQDFDVPGVSGQHTYAWSEMDLHWEAIEVPDNLPSRYDVLSDDDDAAGPLSDLPETQLQPDGPPSGPQGVRGQDEDPDL